MLSKYWPKLMRSYVAEAMTSNATGAAPDTREAEEFLDNLAGGREITETAPGVFRRTETTGDGYRVFTLRSLLPRADFDVHLAKMVD